MVGGLGGRGSRALALRRAFLAFFRRRFFSAGDSSGGASSSDEEEEADAASAGEGTWLGSAGAWSRSEERRGAAAEAS